MTAVCFSAQSALALPACNPGSGHWTLSNGEVKCKKCPVATEHTPGKALKMPFGCMAPLVGALLSLEFYQELKNSKAYAQELEGWRLQLSPTLDILQASVKDASKKLSTALSKKAELNAELQKVLTDKKVLEAKYRSILITSGIAAVCLTVPLVILSINYF